MNNRMHFVKTTIRYIIVFIGLLVFYVLSLLFINAVIDSDSIRINSISGYYVFEEEGTMPNILFTPYYHGQDNFTDSLMINICNTIDRSEESLLNEVMSMDYTLIDDGDFNSIDDLIFIQDEDTDVITRSYARYWHGYVVFLKPMLMTANYMQIRSILASILFVSLIVFLIYCYKELGLKYTLAWLISFWFINYSQIHYSIQCSSVFIATMFCLIIIQLLDIQRVYNNLTLITFILGSIVAFLDLLTTPVVSVGLVLIYASSLFFINGIEFMNILKKLFSSSVSWGLGYGLTWGAKWVLASIILKENVIKNAMAMSQNWTSGVPAGFSKAEWIRYSYEQITTYAFMGSNKSFIVFTLLLLISVLIIISHTTEWRKITPFVFITLAISLLPILWYSALLHHSGMHAFFTYRDLVITSLGVLTIAFTLIDFKKLITPKRIEDIENG